MFGGVYITELLPHSRKAAIAAAAAVALIVAACAFSCHGPRGPERLAVTTVELVKGEDAATVNVHLAEGGKVLDAAAMPKMVSGEEAVAAVECRGDDGGQTVVYSVTRPEEGTEEYTFSTEGDIVYSWMGKIEVEGKTPDGGTSGGSAQMGVVQDWRVEGGTGEESMRNMLENAVGADAKVEYEPDTVDADGHTVRRGTCETYDEDGNPRTVEVEAVFGRNGNILRMLVDGIDVAD